MFVPAACHHLLQEATRGVAPCDVTPGRVLMLLGVELESSTGSASTE
jgi:hypothetical protein